MKSCDTTVLEYAIIDVIIFTEDAERFQMFHHDRCFLRDTLRDFVIKATRKFVAGCKRHQDDDGDFVSSVNHNAEMEKELIDMFFYFAAQQKKDHEKSH